RGMGLVSGLLLDKGRMVEPSIAICTWAYLALLKRRVAFLEGHRRFDEQLAIVCHKAFDQGFWLVEGMRAGLNGLLRRGPAGMQPRWVKPALMMTVLLAFLLLLTFCTGAAAAGPPVSGAALGTALSPPH